jgi:hypothetical protein
MGGRKESWIAGCERTSTGEAAQCMRCTSEVQYERGLQHGQWGEIC